MTHNPHVIPASEPESRWRIKSAMTIGLNVIPASPYCVIPASEPESRWRIGRHSGLDPEPP